MADMRSAGNNIYTVLAFVAFLALLFGVGYVFYRHTQVFSGDNPFAAGAGSAALPAVVSGDLA